MAIFKTKWAQLIELIVLVPVLYELGIGLYAVAHLPSQLIGVVQTAVALIGILVFNHYVSQVKIQWFSSRRFGHQLLELIPALILIVGVQFKFQSLLILLKTPITGLLIFEAGYILLVAVTEEYIYRGVILPVIGRVCHNRVFLSVIVNAFLFGVLHIVIHTSSHGLNYTLPQALMAMAGGLLYAGVYLTTHSLIWPILLHLIDDSSTIIQLGTTNKAVATPTITSGLLGMMLITGLVFVIVALIIVFIQVRKVKLSEFTN